MATTGAPWGNASLSPSGRAVRPEARTRTMARSWGRSQAWMPTTSGVLPSARRTWIGRPSPITCRLVAMSPSASRTNPVPTPSWVPSRPLPSMRTMEALVRVTNCSVVATVSVGGLPFREEEGFSALPDRGVDFDDAASASVRADPSRQTNRSRVGRTGPSYRQSARTRAPERNRWNPPPRSSETSRWTSASVTFQPASAAAAYFSVSASARMLREWCHL